MSRPASDKLGPREILALIGGRLGARLFRYYPAIGRSISRMSALAESAINGSLTAVIQKNRTLAEEVLEKESRVNQMEIDDQAITLLALQQPMAGDLRLITSVIKINTDLERMGDLAVNISQRALADGRAHSAAAD